MENENETKDNAPNEEVIEKTAVTEDKPVDDGGTETKVEDNSGSDDGGSTDFDPSAFSEVSETKVEEAVAEESEGEVEKAVEEGGLDWVTDDNPKTEDTPVAVSEDSTNEVVSEQPNDDAPQKVSTEGFKQVADELGLKFETMDEMKEHLQMIEEENNKLRAASGSGATNEAVKNLENLLTKDNEDLVRLSLEKDGFSGEELDDAVDKYIDNGLIDIEAKKIRNTIDNAIVGEQNKITQSTVDSDAKQQEEHAESVKNLEEHISKTDTMFGFKMAKDEDSLKNVQQGHAKYITSGKFLDDVFANDESLAEAAWFVRNKDVIIKAIANKSLQKGKNAILDDIREPEVVSPQRFRDPEGSNEFDPSKFTARK